MTGRWNHNIHHHPLVLRAILPGYVRALDVGCGEGVLTRELRAVLPYVAGVDRDGPSIDLARAQDPRGEIEYVHADVREADLGRYDLVASVAAVHHIDAAEGLTRLRELVAPGGTLVVIGLARSELPRDLPRELAATATSLVLRAHRGYWEHAAPMVWPPPESYASMSRVAEEILPGSRFRRHLLWRYSLTWTAPRALRQARPR